MVQKACKYPSSPLVLGVATSTKEGGCPLFTTQGRLTPEEEEPDDS
jgi:hypothetical protein